MSKDTSTRDYLALKFFNEDKFNFIGYIFTITIISFYMLITKGYNPTIAYIDLFAFYFCSFTLLNIYYFYDKVVEFGLESNLDEFHYATNTKFKYLCRNNVKGNRVY